VSLEDPSILNKLSTGILIINSSTKEPIFFNSDFKSIFEDFDPSTVMDKKLFHNKK
jgi:hypothetical protein